MPELFASPTGRWTPISSLLARGRLIISLFLALAPVAAGAVVAFFFWPAAIAIWILTAFAVGWVAWWAPRNARSWGWAEASTSIAVKSGLMWRKLEVVPYGRIQLVEVEAGPIASRLGICRLEIRTASESRATSICGLLADDAAALRERLVNVSDPWSPGV